LSANPLIVSKDLRAEAGATADVVAPRSEQLQGFVIEIYPGGYFPNRSFYG
jgi:hypothetical protein